MDVFNALDLMENAKFLEELKFGIGDGNLQYYIYNWKCPQMEANQVNFLNTLKKNVYAIKYENCLFFSLFNKKKVGLVLQ